MKLIRVTAIIGVLIGSATAATINLQVSTTANQATGFSNAEGTVFNGLVWGVMISTTNSSFSELPLGFVLSTALAGKLIPGTDDYFIASPTLTAQSVTEPGNAGKIGIMNSIVVNAAAGAQTGNQIAIVWFDNATGSVPVTTATGTVTGGQKYGIMTQGTWALPNAAGTLGVGNLSFTENPDPVKLANSVTIIPETSTALLGALGALGLLRRRR